MKLNFEEGTPKEVQEILDLQKQAYQSESEIYNDYTIPPLTQSLSEIEKDFKDPYFFVVKDKDRIVGRIKVKVHDNIARINHTL